MPIFLTSGKSALFLLLQKSFILQLALNSVIYETISVIYSAKWLDKRATNLDINPFHACRRSAYRPFLLSILDVLVKVCNTIESVKFHVLLDGFNRSIEKYV